MIFKIDRLSGSKYNYDDLNRVESNTLEIAQKFTQYGYYNNIQSKTDWSTVDFPKTESMNNYLGNVQLIRDMFYSLAPALPVSMNNIDYVDANNIEKNLESINGLFDETVRNAKVLAFTLGGGDFE